MDAVQIQSKVWYGYGKAAQFLGATYQTFHPTDPLNPLSNQTGTLTASFDQNPAFPFTKPADPGKPLYYALGDLNGLALGDYIVSDPSNPLAETYFYSSYEPIKPPQVIRCNRLVSFERPGDAGGMGFTPGTYSSANDINAAPLITGWPASVLEGTKGQNGPVNLAQDTRMGWFKVMLPALPGEIILRSSDVMTDDTGRRFDVSSAELSWTGWRLTVELTVA